MALVRKAECRFGHPQEMRSLSLSLSLSLFVMSLSLSLSLSLFLYPTDTRLVVQPHMKRRTALVHGILVFQDQGVAKPGEAGAGSIRRARGFGRDRAVVLSRG